MAGHVRVLRLFQRPLDGGGCVRMTHEDLRRGLEGERHELGAPVLAARGQLRGVRRLPAGLGEVSLDDQPAPGELVVDLGEQPGVVAGVGEHLRVDGVDVPQGLPGRLDHHHPGPYPLGGDSGPGQHLTCDVPGEVHLAGGDRVLRGLQPPFVRRRSAGGRGVPGREQPERGGHRRRAPVAGQRGGLGEPRGHVQVGPGGRQREVPGPLDRVGGGRGQRGVRGPAFLRGRLRVQRGRDQRMREPYGRPLGLRRQQPERRGLGGLGLGVLPAGRVQQGQRGAGARAGDEQGAPGLVGEHVEAAEHQGAQRGRHGQRLAGARRGRVLAEGAAQFEGEQRVAAAGAVDLADRGAGQVGVAAVVEQRGDLGAGEGVEADGEGVGRGRA
ncbi:hypothetical protein SAURM35S_07331 [Streptomyces aurantiogriseus]